MSSFADFYEGSSNFLDFGVAITDFMDPFVKIAEGASTLLGLINN